MGGHFQVRKVVAYKNKMEARLLMMKIRKLRNRSEKILTEVFSLKNLSHACEEINSFLGPLITKSDQALKPKVIRRDIESGDLFNFIWLKQKGSSAVK